ncbi:MAG: hypothetical protein AB1546_11500 [bacterium]
MKNSVKTATAAFFITALFCAAAVCADMKDPNQIIKKSQDYMLSLDSYSYRIFGEGWDMNPEEIAKRTADTAGDASKQFSQVEDIAGGIKKDAESGENNKPIYRKYECEFKFKKPYLLQMHVIMSDYVPKIIYGSVMTYRPDNNPKVWWFKPKPIPFAVKRDVNSESGDFLYSVITINYAIIEAVSTYIKPSLKGVSKMGGRDAYNIEFKFEKGKKYNPVKVDFKKWGIPKEAQKQFEKEVNGSLTDPKGKLVFYFDKQSMLIIARETFDFDGKQLNLKQWKDIKVNHLSEKDF